MCVETVRPHKGFVGSIKHMEGVNAKWVKMYSVSRSFKYNPPIVTSDNHIVNLNPTNSIDLQKKKIIFGDCGAFGDWRADASLHKPAEMSFYLDKQKALANLTKLQEEKIQNYEASVELQEYIGLTEDEGETAVIISFLTRRQICQ